MLEENKIFGRRLLQISLPIILQQLINSGLNMLDVFMIGQLGVVEITGCGLANQIFFLFTMFIFGINSGSVIFMSQYWGRGDVKGIHKVMGISILLSVLMGLIFALGGIFIPEQILAVYSKDPQVIAVGARYLRIVSVSYVFTGVTTAFGYGLRSIGQTKLPMYVTLLSLICNGVLNSILIFGLLGFPALGVEGAAIATLISRIVEVIVTVVLVYKLNFPIAAKFKEYFQFDFSFFKMFFSTAGFVMLNEIIWSIGTSMYNVGFRYAGTDAQAAVQIATNVRNLFFVITMGIGSAAAVMLGNLLGAGKKDMAKAYVRKFFKVIIVVGILLGLGLFLMEPLILSFFNVTPIVYDYTYKVLLVIALYMPVKCINHLIIVGILRSGGDTTYSLIIDAGTVWVIGVPMSFLGPLVFHLPIYYIMALVMAEELVKLFFGIPRVKTGKWMKDIGT